MQELVRRISVFTLSFSLALAPTYGLAATNDPVATDNGGSADSEFPQLPTEIATAEATDNGEAFFKAYAEANEYNNVTWPNLQVAPPGLPKDAMAADVFLLTQQTVFPKQLPTVRTLGQHNYRLFTLKAMIEQIDEYLQKLSAKPEAAKPFKTVLDEKGIAEAVKKHVDEGRRVDTPLFVWERQHDAAQLTAIRAYIEPIAERWASNIRLKQYNPTDAPMEDAFEEAKAEGRKAPLERFFRHINWWDVSVEVQNADSAVKSLKMRDTSTRATPGADIYYCAEQDSCTFRLNKGIQPLAVYGIEVQTLATYDGYVVFTHDNSYDPKTKTLWLSFLDLKKFDGLIGNEEIPVFRLPIGMDGPATKLEMRGQYLVINDKHAVGGKSLADASSVQHAAFNLTGNLVDLKTRSEELPLLDGVQKYISQYVQEELSAKKLEREGLVAADVQFAKLGQEIQAELDKLKANKPAAPLALTEAQKLAAQNDERFEQASVAIDLYGKRLGESEALAKTMREVQKREGLNRQIKVRVALWVESLFAPRPNLSQHIKNALAVVYMKNGKKGQKAVDRLLQLTADRPMIGASAIAAASLYAVSPETFGQVMEAGLGVGGAVGEYLMNIITNFPESAAKGTQATLGFFTEFTNSVYPQYIANGAWLKTTAGVATLVATLAALVGVPHTIFNLIGLYKDLRKDGRKGEPITDRIIDRQNAFNTDFYKRIAEDEGHRRNDGNDVTFSSEEEAEIQDFIKVRKGEIEKRESRKIFGFWGRKKRAEKAALEAAQREQAETLNRLVLAGDQSSTIQKYKDAPDEFRDFYAAAKNLIFSQPALELSLGYWARIWNSWFGKRNATMEWGHARIMNTDVPVFPLKPRPISVVNYILHPTFISRAAYTRPGQITVPSQANGGLKSIGAWALDGAGALVHKIRPQGTEDVVARLRAVEKFEDQLIKAEDEIVEASFRAALAALPKFMKNKKDMEEVFQYSTITSITDKQITYLSKSSQTFLRNYYESVYEDSMRKYLAEVERRENAALDNLPGEDGEPVTVLAEDVQADVPLDAAPDVDIEQAKNLASVKKLKAALVNLKVGQEAPDYHLDPALARQIAEGSIASEGENHFEYARTQAKKWISLTNFTVNKKFGLSTGLDPKTNRTLARAEVVNRRLKSPSALGRAVRQEISKLKVTTGINIALALVFSAGIGSGAFKPIQDEMFGPNSVMYLSKTSFYMGFASAFFMGLMADAWSKMQADARQDDMGGFGTIPMGEDGEKGFLRWYWKQFTAKDNQAIKNWAYNMKLGYLNLPSAFLNLFLFDYMFSGRFDLSAFTAMFTIGMALPFGALASKLDQAFERSVHYAFRGVKDEKWAAHPEVQKLLLPEMQRMRDKYTWFNDLFWNFFGHLYSTIELIPTKIGTRGFVRTVFGGGLIEEYIVNGAIDPLRRAVHGVPVVEQVVTPPLDFCRSILENPDAVLPGKFTSGDGELFKKQEIDRLGGGDL